MHKINFLNFHYPLPVLIASFLLAVGVGVLLSWHAPQTLASIYPYATLMAYSTAIGLIAFALAIILLRYHASIEAFNRLNFFRRLATGFIFMSLLFIGIGSIGLLQINSVTEITQKLYQGPLQTNNAALRIKSYVSRLNRAIKDVAVNPSLADERNIPYLFDQTDINLARDLTIIERDTSLHACTEKLTHEFVSLAAVDYAPPSTATNRRYRQVSASCTKRKPGTDSRD